MSEDGAVDVDWTGLWEEFGFDTPDAIGSKLISRCQLIGAIECTEQELSGNPQSIIEAGVEDGPLEKIEAITGRGTAITRGYLHTEVGS